MVPTTRENAALVRGFLVDVVAGGDTAAVDAFVAENAVSHNLVFGDGRDPEVALGWRVLAAADVDVTVEEVVASEDRVAVRGTVAGTHRESLMDLAPTGAPFEIAYAWFCRIEDGRIVEIRSLPDGLGLLGQLGVVPGVPPDCSRTRPTEHQSTDQYP